MTPCQSPVNRRNNLDEALVSSSLRRKGISVQSSNYNNIRWHPHNFCYSLPVIESDKKHSRYHLLIALQYLSLLDKGPLLCPRCQKVVEWHQPGRISLKREHGSALQLKRQRLKWLKSHSFIQQIFGNAYYKFYALFFALEIQQGADAHVSPSHRLMKLSLARRTMTEGGVKGARIIIMLSA